MIYFAVAASLAAQQPSTAPPPAVDLSSYPDSEKGLRELTTDMLEAARNGDERRLSAFAEALAGGNLTAWLKSVFGDERGGEIATALEQTRSGRIASLGDGFRTMVKEDLSRVDVLRFEKSCSAEVLPDQHTLLVARQGPVPLYEVRVLDSAGKGRRMWFFAYAEGSFRYLGQIRFSPIPFPPPELPAGSAGSPDQPRRILIGGNVQQARLLEQERPRYPAEAKQARIQGTVKLEALVGIDGRIRVLRVASGHCWLAEAAYDAVKKWRYQPTLLNKQPVEVVTTIDVVFTLAYY